MKYKFFTNSQKAWTAMLEDIKHAQKSIYLESYILTEDPITKGFFDTLREKARRGVKVKIIIDKIADLWWGSINKEEFRQTGAEVLFFNRWWIHRTHRKIMVVDEKTAYVGGVNVSGPYAKWLDLHMRIDGIFVRNLLKSFSRVYELAGGKDSEVLGLRKTKKIFRARVALHKAKLWLLERWPFKGKRQLRNYYKKKCKEAEKSIMIATPYFIPHKWLIRALKSAALRGVKIEVITPIETDIWLANIAHRVFAKNLKGTINFYFIPEMNHAKVLLVDDKEGLVGSNNIDAQSFDFSLEASVVFQRKDMVGNLRNILERWKKHAVPLEKADHFNRWHHKFIGLFIRFLQPIL